MERDPLAVALLAPGLVKGEFGGVSFGGSSVAENSVYINGLNVTDFYNRVGFSSVPFSFYKEFQVKTGGYSVEFGRTTGGVINAVTQIGHQRVPLRRRGGLGAERAGRKTARTITTRTATRSTSPATTNTTRPA